MDERLADRIRSRDSRIGVVGLGYVGLPLAVAYSEAGFGVIGIDSNAGRVRSIGDGQSYLLDVATSRVDAVVRAGCLTASTGYESLRDADVIFVCVPTPFDKAKAPDLGYIMAAAEGLATILRPGQLILLESTTYPGTTEEVLQPILERSGLAAEDDFFLAFSPERIDPGNQDFTIANTPKVVGGVGPRSTALAALALEQVVRGATVHQVSNTRVAELTKLLENTFRAVNIALVNELTMLCDRIGIDVWEVIAAAGSKPYGFMRFYPGPGVGGHCIPVDPYYLAWKAREFDFSMKFIEIAAETNLAMPFFTVDKLRRTLQARGHALHGSRILVLGAAFKPNIDDSRNSAAVRVMEILHSEGAIVSYHDPYVPEVTLAKSMYGGGSTEVLRSAELTDSALADANCVVILVGHSSIDYARIVRLGRIVFDAVNVSHVAGDNVVLL